MQVVFRKAIGAISKENGPKAFDATPRIPLMSGTKVIGARTTGNPASLVWTGR